MKVLLAEDDVMIGENVKVALDGGGISVDWVKNGEDAEASLGSNTYDALLLDLGLPGKDGIEVLNGLRTRGSKLPVLVITARDTVWQRVLGLNNGADDYLVKPFDLVELIARVHALIRRAQGRPEPIFQQGEIVINSQTREVMVSGRQVILSAREWAILDALIARPGTISSRGQLEELLYGWSTEVESNAVEVFIHGLRKKLGAQFIVNVRGLGYLVQKS